MNILMIEDDSRISQFVKRGLEAEGYLMEVAATGKQGLALAMHPDYDLLLLDLMLPDMSGQDICRRLRAKGNLVPILMLTAMDALEDKVEGLGIGADDYLTKPFSFDELLARIQAMLRRHQQGFNQSGNVLEVADLKVDMDSHQVFRSGRLIELTPKEYNLLLCLMSSPGKVFSRTRILDKVWGVSADPLTNVVEVYVRNLRKKIDAENPQSLIKTVRGFGYKLDVGSDF